MSMERPFRSHRLPNGLTAEFFDLSNRYFGDYHRVCLEVRCPVPLRTEWFPGEGGDELDRARRLLGEEVVYGRRLERMGVAGSEVEKTREALVDDFLRTTSSYLGSAEFPSRFIAARLAEKRGRHRLRPVT